MLGDGGPITVGVNASVEIAADGSITATATPYTLKDAALLFESGAAELLDYVIGVTAPAPLRLQRVMQRDNSSREEVMARINKQMDEETKMELCNFIINNDEQEMLIPQVLALHETILLLTKK